MTRSLSAFSLSLAASDTESAGFFGFFFVAAKTVPQILRPSCSGTFCAELGLIFRTFFSGENFGENSAENFPQKMLGKNAIFRGKSLEKLFFQEIPQNFPRKITFRGKNVRKIGP
jgi:hypothetical protein